MKIPYIFLLFFSWGCGTTKFTNSYRKMSKDPQYLDETATRKILEVNVAILPQPPENKQTIAQPLRFFDLRDSLAHAYLHAIEKKNLTDSAFFRAITRDIVPLKQAESSSALKDVDLTQVKIRLLISNAKKYYNDPTFLHPNTRVEFLTTKISLKGNYKITSIDKIENELETIDFAKLERKQEVQFKASLTGEAGAEAAQEATNSSSIDNSIGNTFENNKSRAFKIYDDSGNLVGAMDNSGKFSKTNQGNNSSKSDNLSKYGIKMAGKAELGYANNVSTTENLDIKFKKMLMGISFKEDEITLSQRGSPLSDISNNIVINLTIAPKKINVAKDKIIYKFTPVFNGNIGIQPSALKFLGPYRLSFIPCSDSLSISSIFEGAIRKVDMGKSTRNALEWDDDVKFAIFKSGSNEELRVPINQFCSEVYKVTAENGGEYSLSMDRNGRPETIALKGDSEGISFMYWIHQVIGRLQDGPISNDFINNECSIYFFCPSCNIKTIYLMGKKEQLTATNSTNIKTLSNIQFKKL